MIRFTPALLVLLFPLVLTAEDAKPVAFTSKEGKFSVTLPVKPTEKTTTTKTDAGEVKIHLFLVDQKDRAYIVTYSDYPAGTVGANADKVLGGVAAGNVKSLKGKLASEEKITIGKNKHPGRDIRVEMPEKKGLYRAHIFLVGDRLYQVVALGPDEFAKSKAVDDYLKSFAIEE